MKNFLSYLMYRPTFSLMEAIWIMIILPVLVGMIGTVGALLVSFAAIWYLAKGQYKNYDVLRKGEADGI